MGIVQTDGEQSCIQDGRRERRNGQGGHIQDGRRERRNGLDLKACSKRPQSVPSLSPARSVFLCWVLAETGCYGCMFLQGNCKFRILYFRTLISGDKA